MNIGRFLGNDKYQLNRANFGVSGAQQFGAGGVFDINSSNFGRLTGTFAPRIVQLVGRFEF